MSDQATAIAEAVKRLVDEYRLQCLWFLREDYYPVGDGPALEHALARRDIRFHAGRIGGAFPAVKPGP